ncbi:MAG: recombinase family protein, partial [Gordonibacter sp.]|uniref:recombinase family protein n=1 Tax=Gordonibacter sp. TaxID=1968902 RepID=UPI002FC94AF4
GTNFKRPEFQRLMDDLRQRVVDCVVVKDLSRFGRDHVEMGNLLENVFPFLGVRFIAINDCFDTQDPTSAGSIIVPVKNIVNEAYSRDLSRKIVQVKSRQMEQGISPQGITVYGYRFDREDRTHLVPDEETAKYARLIFKRRLEGVRPKEIAQELNDLGAPTPGMHFASQVRKKNPAGVICGMWESRHITSIVKDPVYTGDLVLHRGEVRDTPTGRRYVRLPESEWLRYPDTHEAFVSKEDFAKLTIQREGRKLPESKRPEPVENMDPVVGLGEEDNVFRHLAYCAECGAGMQACRNKVNGLYRSMTMVCRTHLKFGGCQKNSIDELQLRMLVADQIRVQLSIGLGLQGLLDQLRNLPKAQERRQVLVDQVEKRERELTRLKDKRKRFYEDFAAGRFTREQYDSDKRATECFIAQEKERLDAAKAAVNRFDELFEHDDGMLHALDAVDDITTFSEELLRAMVARIDITAKGSVHITFRFGDWVSRAQKIKRVVL